MTLVGHFTLFWRLSPLEGAGRTLSIRRVDTFLGFEHFKESVFLDFL